MIAARLLVEGSLLGASMHLLARETRTSLRRSTIPGPLKDSRRRGALAKAQFWLTRIGLAGVIVGSIMQTLNGSAVLAAGSALMILGAVILAWLFWERATA